LDTETSTGIKITTKWKREEGERHYDIDMERKRYKTEGEWWNGK